MWFFKKKTERHNGLNSEEELKYLIVGLGNIGAEYADTRHNIGFKVLDAFAAASNTVFSTKRYGDVAEARYKGRTFILLKPSTYMNLSGNAVRYWLKQEKLEPAAMLVITDDLALPTGALRLRSKGSDGGHNGLKSIRECIGTTDFPRLRCGIGNEFGTGQQVNYVLGAWSKEERPLLDAQIKDAGEIIRSFGTQGIERTMNQFNKRSIGKKANDTENK